eukprot:Nitzschia sp. Nitz4//scaffold118_size93875//59066//59773//NITZ4_004792-RA/size93875-processed-gene-0.136-mRNA-1//-1//CDS//3329533736//5256//frame0
MTLLTNKILQQVKAKFGLRMTWELGVIELHRKVPYDYDSEFQDLYMKCAVSLVEGRIDVHQALMFQADTKHGKHTASRDWFDAGVAAVCGLASGIVEYALVTLGGDATVLIDVLVGTTTGAIGGLFYRYVGQQACLPAIFLGTLYWFFYETAFVIGILEIVVGELETGVTRFMAVAVKTFVLTMGAAYGMKLTLDDSLDAWLDQNGN